VVRDALGVLRGMALFRGINEQRLRIVALVGQQLRFRAGEVVFRRGEDGDAAFVVLSGDVEVRVPTAHGDQTVARLGPGELFGEIAVLCDRPRTTTIAADGEVELLRIDREMLGGLMSDLPDLAPRMIRMLAGRLEATTLDLARARETLADESSR
jgi:CRP-like cAMP-binding protein